MINIADKVFGRWTVKERAGIGPGRNALWKCICSCGTEKIVRSNSLRQGMSKSCGCLVTDTNRALNTLPEGEARFNQRLRSYKQSAKEKGHSYELTDVQLKNFLNDNCFYCGKQKCDGVDRVNNVLGYIVSNCRPCCRICNFAKNTMTEAEFFDWIARVYNRCIKQELARAQKV